MQSIVFYFSWPFLCGLCRNIYPTLSPLKFFWLLVFISELWEFLTYFRKRPPYQYMVCKYFLPMWFYFWLLGYFFWGPEVFSLMKHMYLFLFLESCSWNNCQKYYEEALHLSRSFTVFILSLNPFWAYFCVWYKLELKCHSNV